MSHFAATSPGCSLAVFHESQIAADLTAVAASRRCPAWQIDISLQNRTPQLHVNSRLFPRSGMQSICHFHWVPRQLGIVGCCQHIGLSIRTVRLVQEVRMLRRLARPTPVLREVFHSDRHILRLALLLTAIHVSSRGSKSRGNFRDRLAQLLPCRSSSENNYH
jgi:hypothetical protein